MLEKIRTLCIHNMVHKHTTVQQLIMYCPTALTTPLGQVDSPRPDSSLQKITTDWNLQESTVQGPWDRNWKPSMGVGGGDSILKQPVVRYPKNSSFTDLGIKWFKHPPLNQPATKDIPSKLKTCFHTYTQKFHPLRPEAETKRTKGGETVCIPLERKAFPFLSQITEFLSVLKTLRRKLTVRPTASFWSPGNFFRVTFLHLQRAFFPPPGPTSLSLCPVQFSRVCDGGKVVSPTRGAWNLAKSQSTE